MPGAALVPECDLDPWDDAPLRRNYLVWFPLRLRRVTHTTTPTTKGRAVPKTHRCRLGTTTPTPRRVGVAYQNPVRHTITSGERGSTEMPRVITQQHQWVAATYVDLDEKGARRGNSRGTVRIPVDTKVEVLDVVCAMCRRSFDDVSDQPCAAAESTEHLRGGPLGERAKRTHPHHDCERYGCTEGRVVVDRNGQRTA